jgi:hypothetical protein
MGNVKNIIANILKKEKPASVKTPAGRQKKEREFCSPYMVLDGSVSRYLLQTLSLPCISP